MSSKLSAILPNLSVGIPTTSRLSANKDEVPVPVKIKSALPPALIKALAAADVKLMATGDQTKDIWFVWDEASKVWVEGGREEIKSWILSLSLNGKFCLSVYKGPKAPPITAPVQLDINEVEAIVSTLAITPGIQALDAFDRFSKSPWSRWIDVCISATDDFKILVEPARHDHYYQISTGSDWSESYTHDQMLETFLSEMCAPKAEIWADRPNDFQALENWRRDSILYFCGAMILRRPSFALGLNSGPGRGKSTLLKIIDNLIPDKSSVQNLDLQTLDDEKYLAKAAKATLNMAYDQNTKDVVSAKATAAIKKLVFGEPVTVRELWQSPCSLRANVSMIFGCNGEPRFATDDRAIWDRFVILDVGENLENMRKSSQGNPNLMRDLSQPHRVRTFALMAVHTWLTMNRDGVDPRFTKWAEMQKQASALLSSGPTRFLSENYSQEEDAAIPVADVYTHYTATVNAKFQVSRLKFKEVLTSMGVEIKKCESRKSVYENIRGKECVWGWKRIPDMEEFNTPNVSEDLI